MFANKHQFDVPPFKAAFGISSSNALVLPGMEPPDEDFMEHRTMTEGTRVQIKQVWKRKEDGLFVRVAGLIFSEPKRVMWQALPNQDNPSADGLITETEFKEQYEYQPQKRAGQT